MLKRSRGWLALIVMAYLVIAILYAVQVPAWQAPDEPAHYNYVHELVATGSLPVLGMGDYDETYLEQLKSQRFPPELSVAPLRYEGHQPPLYYVLQGVPFYLAAGNLLALRLLSVLLGAIFIVLTYEIARLVLPRRPLIHLGSAALVAFLPMHVAMAASVNNDALAEVLLAAILFLSLRYVKLSLLGPRKPSSWDALALGLLVGAAMITKVSAYVAIPIALAAPLIGWYEAKGRRGETANQRKGETANERMDETANQRISESANGRRGDQSATDEARQEGATGVSHAESEGNNEPTHGAAPRSAPPDARPSAASPFADSPFAHSPSAIRPFAHSPFALHALLILIPALLLALPWFVRNASVYGHLDILARRQHDAIVVGQLRTAELLAQAGLTAVLERFVGWSFDSFWGVFGWMGVWMDGRIYTALLAWTLAVAMGCVALLAHNISGSKCAKQAALRVHNSQFTNPPIHNSNPQRFHRYALALLGLSALLSLAIYLSYNLIFVQPQGRYLFPALPAIALAVALGWQEALRPSSARWAGLTLLIASLVAAGWGRLHDGINKWSVAILGGGGLLAWLWSAAVPRLQPATGRRLALVAFALPYVALAALSLYALYAVILPQLT